MEAVSDNHNSCQSNASVDMSVNVNASSIMADQNGGGDADKSPRRGNKVGSGLFDVILQ